MILKLIHSSLSQALNRSSSSVWRNSASLRLIVKPTLTHQCDTVPGLRGYADDSSSEKEKPKEEIRDPRSGDPSKDISVETSMRYLKSDGYKQTYGDDQVWVMYRRNFKGQFAPKKTRETCFRLGRMAGNPCPICRDEYLILDYRNVDLLKQFISPFNGAILGTEKTGLCQAKHFKLLAEIEKAKDYGTITFDIPFREFDYEEFYPKHLLDKFHYHSTKRV